MPSPVFRRATEADLPVIIAMLADDKLGSTREDTSPEGLAPYRAAFREMERDANQMLVVMERDGAILGTCQLTFIPGISQRGMKRGQIEGVRIAAGYRGEGLGEALIGFALEESRRRGCGSVQLTSNKGRRDAIRFYERLGFVASHEGMKFTIP